MAGQEEKDSELVEAAARGDAQAVEALILAGADARAGWSHAFRMAARDGYHEIVEKLLNHNAHVNAMGDQALFFAIARNDAALAETLVKHGAKIMRAVINLEPHIFSDPARALLFEKINLWGEAEKIFDNVERGQERAAYEDIFRLIYGDYNTLDDLRAERAGSRGHTGLTLAAAAGLMPEIIAIALPDPKDRLEAADFLTKDRAGRTVVGLLALNDAVKAAQHGLAVLFNGAFWRGRENEAEKLFNGINPSVAERIDLRLFRTEKNLSKLDAIVRKRPRP